MISVNFILTNHWLHCQRYSSKEISYPWYNALHTLTIVARRVDFMQLRLLQIYSVLLLTSEILQIYRKFINALGSNSINVTVSGGSNQRLSKM